MTALPLAHIQMMWSLFCGGTLLKLKSLGYSTAIVDLTQGELSTNGDVATRQMEAEQAAAILHLDKRINLSIPDGMITADKENRTKIIKTIRKHRPDICLIPYWKDRHPDHTDASRLVQRAIFESGLSKIGDPEEAYRPKTILYYMMHDNFRPSFVVDISDEMQTKKLAIMAYESQFSSLNSRSKPTAINQTEFLKFLTDRSAYLGYPVGAEYGEGFYYKGVIKIDNLMEFFT